MHSRSRTSPVPATCPRRIADKCNPQVCPVLPGKEETLLLGFGVVILGGVATVEGLWPHPLETPPSLAEEPMRYGCVRPGQLLGAAGRCQVLCAGPPASLAGGRVLPWLRQCGSHPERA